MKKEIPVPAIIGAIVLLIGIVIGLFVYVSKPEPVPTGRVDTTLPPPIPRQSGKPSRFAPKLDTAGAQATQSSTIGSASGE